MEDVKMMPIMVKVKEKPQFLDYVNKEDWSIRYAEYSHDLLQYSYELEIMCLRLQQQLVLLGMKERDK